MAHTPGPWRAIDSGESNWCITDQHGHQVSSVFGDAPDAHLIAAAPDLLEACRHLVALIDPHDVTPEFLVECHAVITKAEGETGATQDELRSLAIRKLLDENRRLREVNKILREWFEGEKKRAGIHAILPLLREANKSLLSSLTPEGKDETNEQG